VPADELASRKLSLIGASAGPSRRPPAWPRPSARWSRAERSPAELKTRIGSIEAVAPADVQRYAAAHFGAAGRRLAIAGVADRSQRRCEPRRRGSSVVAEPQLDLERAEGLRRE
jgi:hypothetical protein